MPPPAAAISSGPGSPRQPIAGTPAGHRLDVGDAERLVDAREHEHRAAAARSRRASAFGSWPVKCRRAADSPARAASRSSAGRSGPSPTTIHASAGWESRSSHSARRTSAWRLRATRWATVTSAAAPSARRPLAGQVGAEVHDAGGAGAERAGAALDRARVREHQPRAAERARGPPARRARRSATDSTSPPWTETTYGAPGRGAAHGVAGGRGVVGVHEVVGERAPQAAQGERQRRAPPTRPSSRSCAAAAARANGT